MLTILYNLFAILVVLVSILLSVGLLAVIERKLVGSMQQRIQPNTAEHYTQLQPFTVRIMVVVLILSLTTLALLHNVWFDPIYCQEAEALATNATNRTAPQADKWDGLMINGTWSALNLYGTYKIFQLKCSRAYARESSRSYWSYRSY